MAWRTGLPQHELSARFTIDEIRELFALRKIDYESTSKEDVRIQSLAYYISHAVKSAMGGKKAVSGMKAEHYAFNWKDSVKPIKKKSKAEHDLDMLSMAICYGGTIKEDGREIKIKDSRTYKELREKVEAEQADKGE